MNFTCKNIAATGETVQTVDSGHGTCGGVVQGAIPQQQVVVLAYPMQLAAAKTLHASTEIVECCQTACCYNTQDQSAHCTS